MIRVLFVEDEAWVRQAVASILDRPAEGVALAAVFEEALPAIAGAESGLPFDVGLIDLGLPDLPGIELLRKLRSARPDAALVVFTVYDDADTVFAALRAGARGYLLKNTPPERIVPALLDARAGGSPLSPAVARMIIDTFREVPLAADEAAAAGLTRRETEVLTLLAKGVTYAQVGSALGIALGTVQAHVRRIYEKLEIGSKAEAAVVAAKLGFV